jgi:hypothetical protein
MSLNFPFASQPPPSGTLLKPVTLENPKTSATKSLEPSKGTNKTSPTISTTQTSAKNKRKKRQKKVQKHERADSDTDSDGVSPQLPKNQSERTSPKTTADQPESRPHPLNAAQSQRSNSRDDLATDLTTLNLILDDILRQYNVKDTLKYVLVLTNFLQHANNDITIKIIQFLLTIAIAAQNGQ